MTIFYNYCEIAQRNGGATTVFVAISITVSVIIFMKIQVIQFLANLWRLSLMGVFFFPFSSHAEIRFPYWLDPVWIQEKLTDMHIKNKERIEQTQGQAKKNNNANGVSNGTGVSNSNSGNGSNGGNGGSGGNGVATNGSSENVIDYGKGSAANKDQLQRVTNLAPVEVAVPKINEKHLTKDELRILRTQLRQQN